MKSGKYHGVLLKFFFLGSCLLLSWKSAMAQTLYGAADPDSNNISDLYTIDPVNGDATLIGPIGFRGVTGLAFLPDGRLIGSARDDSSGTETAVLLEVDPVTGEGTLIGAIDTSQNGCGRMPDISFDRASNTLFGVGNTCLNGSRLYTIDFGTGDGTPAANATGFTGGGNGLAIHPQNGTIYHTPSDATGLVTIDPSTGEGALIQGTDGNVPSTIKALDFRPVTLELYGVLEDAEHSLIKINLANGTPTTLGLTVDKLDAIAFSNFCGDGQPAFNEQCDDGNLVDGDGCEPGCTLTPSATPSPIPSAQPFDGGLSGSGNCALGLAPSKGVTRGTFSLLGLAFFMLILNRKSPTL